MRDDGTRLVSEVVELRCAEYVSAGGERTEKVYFSDKCLSCGQQVLHKFRDICRAIYLFLEVVPLLG